MSRRLGIAFITIAVGLALVVGAGCRKGTPTTCKGWAKLLKSPVKGRDAIKNLGDLRCKESIPDLEGIFATSQYKEDILQSVKVFNAPQESVGLVKKGLADPFAATLAAAVAEDFALADFRQPLLDILTGDKALKARENALKALARIDAKNLKQNDDLLRKLLRNDPNVQGVAVNALAAKLLGDVKSETAVPDRVVALFMRTQRGEQLYTPVRKTLAKIGKPAVAPMVAVLTGAPEGEPIRKELADMSKKLGLFDWQWQEGPEIIQVLGDLRDPSAAPAVAASLAKTLNPPVGVDDRVLRTWQVAQQNRITMCMMSLWNLGTAAVVDALKEVVVNPDNDAKQRLDTASALAMMQDFVGMGALMAIYSKTTDPRFRAPLVKPISLGVDWAHVDEFLRMVGAEKDELVRSRVTGDDPDAKEFKALIGVVKDCKQGDVPCLVQRLKGPDLMAAEKAAILLAASKGEAAKQALAALIETYPATDPVTGVDLRRFILLAIWRLGDPSTVKDLEKMLQSDRDRKGAGYWIDELETFIPVLSSRSI
ncbi:MAG: hypothetical protein FJ087_03930 [Deltaproteobacteria bacterium]|nr:hypothetical protein [Deltaproteobacteria bacterium]